MNMIIDQAMPFWDDELACWVIKETEEWVVCVVPMIFNDRICIADKRELGRTWTAGWCYEKTWNATLAASFAAGWNLDLEWRPLGFKKIAFDTRDMSHCDPVEWQYVCRWCQGGLRINDVKKEDDAHICAQCGSLRDQGAYFEGIGTQVRFPEVLRGG